MKVKVTTPQEIAAVIEDMRAGVEFQRLANGPFESAWLLIDPEDRIALLTDAMNYRRDKQAPPAGNSKKKGKPECAIA